LAEAPVEVEREIYVAVFFDKSCNQPVVMASAAGGVDIETVARETPQRVMRQHVDPFIGLPQYTVRHVAKALALQDVAGLGRILTAMYDLLWSNDAALVEINPLAETAGGLIALDAKVTLDDKAAYRHADLFHALAAEQADLDPRGKSHAETLAKERGLTYVLLDGNVGLISDGAGTGMLALDLIQDAGGRAANFCELGGLTTPKVMYQAIEVVLANPNVQALLISLIGGVTRMDEMADGILQYLETHGASVPLVIRMCGTQEAVGKATLHRAGLETFDDLPAAVRNAVALAGGSPQRGRYVAGLSLGPEAREGTDPRGS
jgi:succinyl-CoA synthetase beta subunit